MKLELTDDLVLIEPLSRPTITNAGIELPEPAQQAEPRYGEVIDVGPGKPIEGPTYITYDSDNQPTTIRDGMRFPMSVKTGDRVFYSVMNFYPLIYNGNGHFLIREHAIFAVITEDEFRYETIVSKQPSRVQCPQHGTSVPKCTLMEAVHDGRRGVYCLTSQKFYSEKDLDAAVKGKDLQVASEYKCPEHGRECGLRYCVREETMQKGGFCPISDKFYPEEELKGE